MKKTLVLYGSDTGNTETAAKQIADKLGADVVDVAKNPADKIADYEFLVLGTPTMGIGDLQDDWESFLPALADADLSGKTIALFGLGDADMYPDSFLDGIGTIYEAIKDKGCTIIGHVDAEGYVFDASTALIDDKFIGLPLDEDNESDLSEGRIEAWIEQLKEELD